MNSTVARYRHGFSRIEACVVLIILALLAALAENKGVRNRIRQLQRETVPDTFIVFDDNRWAESEFTNRSRDNIDGLIIQTGIVFVRTQLRELPLFDLHWTTFPGDKEAERVGRWLGRESFNTSHCADGSSGMTPEA